MDSITALLNDETATVEFGARVARACPNGAVVYLHGELGAGKTTFTRGFLHALGVRGNVKSPTFTVVEPYEINGRRASHFDLYRIADPGELELLGLREYFAPESWVLIEWPERGAGVLPPPDLDVNLNYVGAGRSVTLRAVTGQGRRMLASVTTLKN